MVDQCSVIVLSFHASVMYVAFVLSKLNWLVLQLMVFYKIINSANALDQIPHYYILDL